MLWGTKIRWNLSKSKTKTTQPWTLEISMKQNLSSTFQAFCNPLEMLFINVVGSEFRISRRYWLFLLSTDVLTFRAWMLNFCLLLIYVTTSYVQFSHSNGPASFAWKFLFWRFCFTGQRRVTTRVKAIISKQLQSIFYLLL